MGQVMNENNIYRAAIYCRLSKARQRTDGHWGMSGNAGRLLQGTEAASHNAGGDRIEAERERQRHRKRGETEGCA